MANNMLGMTLDSESETIISESEFLLLADHNLNILKAVAM